MLAERGEGGEARRAREGQEMSKNVFFASSRTLAFVRLRRGEGEEESEESSESGGGSEEEELLMERWGEEGGEGALVILEEGVEESFVEKEFINLAGKESLGEVGRLGERGRVAEVRARGDEGGEAAWGK